MVNNVYGYKDTEIYTVPSIVAELNFILHLFPIGVKT